MAGFTTWQGVFGLSPFHLSLCFGLNALTIGIGAAIGPQFKHTNTALKCGAIDFLIAAICLSFCLFVHALLVVVMGFYIYLLVSFGLMQPGLTATALDAERQNAGAASAIFGASSIIMVLGALLCLLLTLPLCKRLREKH